MGNACQRCRLRSCCQTSEVASNEEVLEDTKDQNSVQVTDHLEHARRHRTSLQEAKLFNQDAITKLMQSLLIQRPLRPDSVSTAPSGSTLSHAKHLRLKVLSSNVLQKMSVIHVTPTGYEHSLRNEKDGFVFFGSKKRTKGSGHFKGPIVNDFIIPSREQEKQPGRHFQIRYDSISNAYFVRNLGAGIGLFLKIDGKMVVTENCLVHIGESYLLFNLLTKGGGNPRIRILLYGGISTGQVFYYEPEDFIERPLLIGRDQSCDISIGKFLSIDDTLISKVQSGLRFSQLEGWVLSDGNRDSGRPSTNGTWVYVQEDTELRPNMILKVGQTLFQASV